MDKSPTAVSERPFVRADGFDKVSGLGLYTGDLAIPGMASARFLYADHASARIVKLDTSRALSLPGVYAVLTHETAPAMRYGPVVRDRTLFAADVTRFDKEIVAAVAAMDDDICAEACARIDVEYELVEPVLDPEEALKSDSGLVHPLWDSYLATDGVMRSMNDCGYANIRKGDVDAGFAAADVIVAERYVADMSHAVPIEPHAVIAQWHGPRLTIWSSTQMPFVTRTALAELFEMPERDVRVLVPHLGGGFGGKCEFHFEGHVAALARAAQRPVRLIFDRTEEFTATDMTRHPVITEVRTGLTRDGTILVRQARLVLDTGAYAAHGPVCSEIATMMATGPYRIPNLFIEAHAVYTNKTPAGSVRAPTGPQVCWAIEQHTDVCAGRIELDAVEFRLKNLVREGDEGPTGQRLTAVGGVECLERAASRIGWGRRLAPNEGLGVAVGWWFSYPSPSGAFVKLNPDGSATIVTGAQENGSGAVMGLAILAADELGLSPEQVDIVYQDTGAGPYDFGSAGSQTTFNNGRAVVAAARQVGQRLLELAADQLEIAPGDLELREGAARVRGSSSVSVSVADLAEKAMGSGELILGTGSGTQPSMPDHQASACAGRVAFPAFVAPSFFCHAVRLQVDPETGVAEVADVVAVHDFGRVINPTGAEGQVEGGAAHGMGIALTEGTRFLDGVQRNSGLLDYKLQTASDVPRITVEFVERPAPDGGPRGIKGVGEPPVVPTAGAIGNAIAAAILVRVRRLPMTPMRVWEASERFDW
jgi:CO/xanthine dehydrogenase Mo-binding subunit